MWPRYNPTIEILVQYNLIDPELVIPGGRWFIPPGCALNPADARERPACGPGEGACAPNCDWQVQVLLDGYLIDVVERWAALGIQTRSFSAIRTIRWTWSKDILSVLCIR